MHERVGFLWKMSVIALIKSQVMNEWRNLKNDEKTCNEGKDKIFIKYSWYFKDKASHDIYIFVIFFSPFLILASFLWDRNVVIAT